MSPKAAEYEEFERVTVEAHQREPIRILAYCILNRWHFVVWPERDGQLSHFFQEGRPRKGNRSDTDSAE